MESRFTQVWNFSSILSHIIFPQGMLQYFLHIIFIKIKNISVTVIRIHGNMMNNVL